jgi:hypothetical protein
MSSPRPGSLPRSQQGLLRGFRAALESVPLGSRAALARFWVQVRENLADLDREIRTLRGLRGAVPLPPSSTASARDVRDEFDEIFANLEGCEDQSPTLGAIRTLTQSQAMSILEGMRDLGQANDLGCWFGQTAPSHRNGYVKINLRNTRRQGGNSGFIGVQPFAHQLAVVASGRGYMLNAVAQPDHRFNVSHLCHNPGCFNPQHCVVEESSVNRLRNQCQASVILELPDGTVYNPCPHWNMGSRRMACILPTVNLRGDGRWQGRYIRAMDGNLGSGVTVSTGPQTQTSRQVRRHRP